MIDADTEFKGSFTRIFQGVFKPYMEFGEKHTKAVHQKRQIKSKENQQHLLNQLSLVNANEDCHVTLHPVRER